MSVARPATVPGAPTGDVVETGFKPKVTEIGQIYVVMPVPDSVRKAGGK